MRSIKREVNIGGIKIGGNNPIPIQSMTNTDTRDYIKTTEQILRLEEAGCEIIRCAVPDLEAAKALKKIKENIHIPIVADIHFDYRLALESIKSGVDKIRINPGNIGSEDRVKKVVEAAKANCVPIRIGVNGGSLEKDLLLKYKSPCADALVESALRHVEILDNLNFSDIVVSIKVSDCSKMIEAYKKFDKISDIPLHIGLTEAGTLKGGIIKSAIGIGALLSNGIGDTIRVSLTADPVEEIYVAKEILKNLGLKCSGIEFVSCPTCGRTKIDLIKIASEVEKRISNIDKPLKVAVMGCAVNGPGEAKDADIGIAGGDGKCLIFKSGEILRSVPENEVIDALLSEIEKM